MSDFIPMQKGQENWQDKYNADMLALRGQLASREHHPLAGNVETFPSTVVGYYSKDAFGAVILELDANDNYKDSLQSGVRVIVGTLPEGFRPGRSVYFSVVFTAKDYGITSGYGAVGKDGTVHVIPPVPMPEGITGLTSASGCISFVAKK